MATTRERIRTRAEHVARDPLLAPFAERLAAKADPRFLESYDADAIVAMAEQGLDFLRRANLDDVNLELLEPRIEPGEPDPDVTILLVALRDRPFLVDSLRAEIERQAHTVRYLLHPILHVVHGHDGGVDRLVGQGAGGTPVSFEMVLLDRLDDQAAATRLLDGVRKVLGDVILATEDYEAMRQQAHTVAEGLRRQRQRNAQGPLRERAEELEEYADFLSWLDDDNFVFLGYRAYDLIEVGGERALQADVSTPLGILRSVERSAYATPVPIASLRPGLRERITGGRLLVVTKTNAASTVHRPARMDYVGVKKLGDSLHVLGEHRFLGLFTSKAVSTPIDETPILRRLLRRVLELDDASPGSHDYKQIVSIVQSMPRSELFWRDPETLHRDVRTIMTLEQTEGVRLTLRDDPLGRGLALMVIMPREKFSGEVRHAIQTHLAARLGADHVDYTLAMGEDEAQVRFHFFFVTTLPARDVDLHALESEVVELTRSYRDHLFDALARRDGRLMARQRLDAWFASLPDRYKADVQPGEAVGDLDNLVAMGDDPILVDLLDPSVVRTDPRAPVLKIYHRRTMLALSDVMPILENLGLRVIEQVAYPLRRADDLRVIDVYRVLAEDGAPLDVARNRAHLVPALTRLLGGGVNTDILNRLVLSLGISLREVELLRAYQRYYAQIAVATSRAFLARALVHHPPVVRALLDLFAARHDPRFPGGGDEAARDDAEQRARAAFTAALDGVTSLAEDEVLRGIFDLVLATVRTNYYLTDGAIALKIASRHVATMPEPRPLYEIGVSGYGLEGTHLRGGLIARGGIRWSERPDDFRTEILGLMKTQMTKNAVIVPVGAKGGFVVEHAPSEPEALRSYVEEQYRTFIDALLSVTDDREGESIVHPPGMRIHDGDDPYLVVAADKGTATFSDAANRVAEARGFWLGDAFASGGSHGYDHKKEGITARGAWESVRRHFRELGIDPETDPVRVVAIGDMSGDVFGNGMLYTKQLRLVAAFNHQHIFLDPEPDPAASWRERARLFGLPRSTWRMYDTTAISEGGGVFERSAKSVPLSPEARALLGVSATALSGPELIRAILKMPVDLLWNGGIGTYVKASTERHGDVGDAANDAVRVNGNEVRARVVGEGGNLGFTQRARIEVARRGTRIDTDAVHNVGGVDMSDREVNLKILLAPMVRSGAMTVEARNELLVSMTAEVSSLVLRDAARQSLALSLAERRAVADPALFASLQEYLEERGGLDADVEFLPNARERASRLAAGETYTRPELAILLAYVKMGTYRRLLETDFPSEPALLRLLEADVPAVIRARFAGALAAHPLRREMVATIATNVVVDLLGPTFVHRMRSETGGSPATILRAALMALDLLDAHELFKRLDTAGTAKAEVRYAAMEELVTAVEGVVAWLVHERHAEASMLDVVARFGGPLAKVRQAMPDLVRGGDKRAFTRRRKAFEREGIAPDLALQVASLDLMPAAAFAVRVAEASKRDLVEVAGRFFEVGERLSLTWLRDALSAQAEGDDWRQVALQGLIMDLRTLQMRITADAMLLEPREDRRAWERYLTQRPALAGRYEPALARVKAEGDVDVASGSVLVRILEGAIEPGFVT